MAVLDEFLGSVISSVSNARVQADIQTIKIASEYATNDLLQHFAVPRMRFKDVEIKIPFALESLKSSLSNEPRFELKDIKSFPKITNEVAMKVINVEKLPSNVTKSLEASLIENTQALEAKLKDTDAKIALREFSNKISSIYTSVINVIYKEIGKEPVEKTEVKKIQSKISTVLQETLLGELKPKTITVNNFSNVNIVVEAEKLREIKPENLIMITMKISEEGMEWHSFDNIEGEKVSKLIPE